MKDVVDKDIVDKDAVDQGPHHLAQTVLRALSVSALEPPDAWQLDFFFDVLHQASFRAAEGQSRGQISRIVWQSQTHRPDPAKSGHLLLRQPVPISVSSLTALLAGVQGGSALLVSGGDAQLPAIQGITYEGIICGGESLCPATLFRVEILGPAHLRVDAGLDYPIELRRNRLSVSGQNVLGRGTVRERLSAMLQDLFPAVRALLPGDIASSPFLAAGPFPLPGGAVLMQEQDWAETLEQFWVSALAQLLGTIFEARAGGSVLLAPRRNEFSPNDWLPAPHEAAFSQLRHLLEKRAAQAIISQVQAVQALADRAASLHALPPDDLALREAVRLDPPGADPEIAQAVQLLAPLSRVDGVLRLDPDLDLLSFGGQPSAGSLPERVYLAENEAALDADLTPISSRSFGPRNQALLRLCHQDPDAVGFVFTSDGEIRAMLRHGDKLVVWNNVHLPRRQQPHL